MSKILLGIAGLIFITLSALGSETIGVSGSGVRFSTVSEYKLNNKQTKRKLPRVEMSSKILVNVYATESYAQEGVNFKSAEELVKADTFKQLQLVMERQVDGRDMAASFRSSVLLNHKEEEFPEELALLDNLFKETKVIKGDQIKLTHIPGVGIHCLIVDKIEVTIKSIEFSKAIWEIYLGKNNLGDGIKKSLIGKL